MRNSLIVVLLLAIMNSLYSQSAWVKPKGELYSQLSFNDISNYTRVFNKNGNDFYPSRAITDRTIQWYTEYGLTNKITVLTSVPYKLIKTGKLVPESTYLITINKGTHYAFGNISAAMRYKLPSKKYAISTQLQVELPTSVYREFTGTRSGIGAYTIIPTIAFGKGKENLFFQFYTGVFLRTNNYSNGFKLYLEGGKRFFDQLWAIGFVDIVDSFEDGSIIAPIKNLETFLYLNNSEYVGFGIKIIEELNPKFGITAAFGGAFSAHLEAHKASINFGVYYKCLKTKEEF